MHFERLNRLPDVIKVQPNVFRDYRGWFMESYSLDKLRYEDISDIFVQDNHLCSEHIGVLRGIHFQNAPHAQAKLLRCTAGRVMDYAVDLRKGSPTYLHWDCLELTEDGFEMLYIPVGFGHAVVSLTERSELQYKVSHTYVKESDRSIAWNDPALNIQWPFSETEIIVSEKDAEAPQLKDSDCNFTYE